MLFTTPLSSKGKWILAGSIIGVGVILTVVLVLVLVVFKSHPSLTPTPTPNPVPTPTTVSVDCVVEFDETLWSECDASCGSQGQQVNTQGVIVVKPVGEGQACPPLTATRVCQGNCYRSLHFQTGFSFGAIDPQFFSGAFTVGVWIMLETAPPNGEYANILRLAGVSTDWRIYAPNLEMLIATGRSERFDPLLVAPGNDQDYTHPTCLVYRWRPETLQLDLFVNNAYHTSSALSNVVTQTHSLNLFDNSGTDSQFQPQGRMQELRLWNTQLSDDEIKSFYNQGRVTRQPIRKANTVAVFHMNEGSGTDFTNAITQQKWPFASSNLTWDQTDFFRV